MFWPQAICQRPVGKFLHPAKVSRQAVDDLGAPAAGILALKDIPADPPKPRLRFFRLR
jgi:hypothetical protein